MYRLSCCLFLAASALAADDYVLGPDSQPHPGVPKGKVTKYSWSTSEVFPGTTRDYWVYVPAQYDGSKPACVMIFQDGGGMVGETGSWRVPIVFDNLIQQGAMPVTIGIFIDPGVLPAPSPAQQSRFNRSYEYDSLGGRYAYFLTQEILPEVGKLYKLSSDPNDRALAGSSSGGIAAFTAAWERPDAFRRVASFVGSFTNLRAGDMYASLIRKMEPKPLRVFLQDGSNDQTIYSGSWYLANQEVAASLDYSGYDARFVVGTEGHNGKHGAAILPEVLRWLWRDYPQPVRASKGIAGRRHYVTEILDPDHDWEVVGQGYKMTEGPAVDRDGNVYFCDAEASRIYKVDARGKVELFKEDTGGATGLMFGGDGRLYAAESARKRVVAYGADGKIAVLATGVAPNDLAVTSKGAVYFTDSPGQKVWYIDPAGAQRVVFDASKNDSILLPNGVRLTPDEALLVVADTVGRSAWSFRIQPDGSLDDGQPFYHLELPDDVSNGPLRSGADGMTFDNTGHLYVATKMGVQICDQPGRVVGIIRTPGAHDVSNLVFGGADLQTLYATAGNTVYRRRLRRKGVFPWEPVKLPRPQL
ncbi:MAG: SMP-30/gluconolactonase/LRE family protein [Bryobacteraceae bacterium]